MKLVPACLSGREDQERRFHHWGGHAKHVQDCFSARKDRESRFHHCGSLVKLVEACLRAGKTGKAVLSTVEVW